MIVLDASAAVELLLGGAGGEAVAERVFTPGESLHAPHLLDTEVVQVLRRYWHSGELTATRGRQALEDYLDLGIERYPVGVLLPRIWALRHNLTAYDAAYVALAEALGAPLLTRDARIAAAPGHGAIVEVV